MDRSLTTVWMRVLVTFGPIRMAVGVNGLAATGVGVSLYFGGDGPCDMLCLDCF
jgi:hypothetical protein